MGDYDIDPDRTVWWTAGTRQNEAGGPVIHLQRDCGYLSRSDSVRRTQRKVLYEDCRICAMCKYYSDEYPAVTRPPGGVGADPDVTDHADES